MNVFILGPKNPGFEEEKLIMEAEKTFDKCDYFKIPSVRVEIKNSLKVISNGKNLLKFSAVIPRIPPTYINFGYVITKILEKNVLMPIKPESLILTHNKYMTLMALYEMGIDIPKTYLITTRSSADSVLKKIKYPVIIKTLYGSKGRGVVIAESISSAKSMLDVMESRRPVIIQEYLKEGYEDIRAVVVGNKVIGAMKRKAQDGEFRSNIGAGGVGKKIKLGKKMSKIAEKTSKIIGADVVGVDIIDTKKGPKVVEANINVNFEGMYKYCKINVAKEIVKYMKNAVYKNE